jgi:hypothetical protein
MAFKKLSNKLPPRLWMLSGRSGDGKSLFSMQMRGPLLPIDADHKLHGVAQHAVGELYEFSTDHADALSVDAICRILDEDMPGSGVGTIVLDSITPILEPIILDAMAQAQQSKSKIAPFQAKANAVKRLTHALHKWGCDVLWIYHIETTHTHNGEQTERTSIPATELARIAKSVNMRLSIVCDGDRRGVRVDYAQHGKYGMVLWDDSGHWAGRPEQIEQAVYADGVKAQPTLPTGFSGPEDAIAWAWGYAGAPAFHDALHVKNAYQKLKEEHKPQSAQEMWDLFIADVMHRKIAAEQTDAVWEWPEPAAF